MKSRCRIFKRFDGAALPLIGTVAHDVEERIFAIFEGTLVCHLYCIRDARQKGTMMSMKNLGWLGTVAGMALWINSRFISYEKGDMVDLF